MLAHARGRVIDLSLAAWSLLGAAQSTSLWKQHPTVVAELISKGLACERILFGRNEVRLTDAGRRMRAKYLEICPMCERPLARECLPWCTERSRASIPA